jgi:hypothetical protein
VYVREVCRSGEHLVGTEKVLQLKQGRSEQRLNEVRAEIFFGQTAIASLRGYFLYIEPKPSRAWTKHITKHRHAITLQPVVAMYRSSRPRILAKETE